MKYNIPYKSSLLTFLFSFGIGLQLNAQSDKWKTEARNRIDQYRKNNITLKITDSLDRPITNAIVDIKLIKHKFYFGAVVHDNFSSSPYTELYKKYFKMYFNASGFENELKPKGRGKREKPAEITIKWFNENNFYVRGHALVWEGLEFLRPEEKAIINNNTLSDDAKVKQVIPLISQHFYHAIPKWNVNCWDVVNEPISNDEINKLTPINTFSFWYTLADKIRKENNKQDVKLYINENRVISATVKNNYNRLNLYKDIIRQIIKDKVPLEGIGFQSRIKQGFVTPQQMWDRLNAFNEFSLPLQGTEFEIKDIEDGKIYTDEEKKQIVEQFMLIYASHPLVEGIWHWTFNNDSSNNKPWALFNYDGTPTVCAKQWMETMRTDFDTHILTKPNESGMINTRGFKGEYIISINYNNKKTNVKMYLDQDENYTIKL